MKECGFSALMSSVYCEFFEWLVNFNGFDSFVVKPLIYQFRSIVQTEGEILTLECLSQGDPAPNMTFRKAGQQRDYVIGENVIVFTLFT